MHITHDSSQTAIRLLERFAGMIREHGQPGARARLDQWLEDAEHSGILKIRSFVTKLLQDVDAMVAGLELPYSQG